MLKQIENPVRQHGVSQKCSLKEHLDAKDHSIYPSNPPKPIAHSDSFSAIYLVKIEGAKS